MTVVSKVSFPIYFLDVQGTKELKCTNKFFVLFFSIGWCRAYGRPWLWKVQNSGTHDSDLKLNEEFSAVGKVFLSLELSSTGQFDLRHTLIKLISLRGSHRYTGNSTKTNFNIKKHNRTKCFFVQSWSTNGLRTCPWLYFCHLAQAWMIGEEVKGLNV